jgi:hypothetical protein
MTTAGAAKREFLWASAGLLVSAWKWNQVSNLAERWIVGLFSAMFLIGVLWNGGKLLRPKVKAADDSGNG